MDPNTPLERQEYYILKQTGGKHVRSSAFLFEEFHAKWSEIDRQVMIEGIEARRFHRCPWAKRRYGERREALIKQGFQYSDMEWMQSSWPCAAADSGGSRVQCNRSHARRGVSTATAMRDRGTGSVDRFCALEYQSHDRDNMPSFDVEIIIIATKRGNIAAQVEQRTHFDGGFCAAESSPWEQTQA